MSLLIGTGKLAAPLGLLIAGPLTEWVGVRTWFFVAGGGWLLLNLVAFTIPALVNLEEERKTNGQVVMAE
jgi:DHA3 family macrolide efflux protein-like MFS transporter